MPSRNNVLSWDRRLANIGLWSYSEAGPSEGKDKPWGAMQDVGKLLSSNEQMGISIACLPAGGTFKYPLRLGSA